MTTHTTSHTRRARSRRAVSILVLALLGGSALTGCAPEGPTIMKTPDIVWADNKPPSSPLEDTVEVKAMRAQLLGRALAWNTGDFTLPQFTDHAANVTVLNLADAYHSPSEHFLYPGPIPVQPVSIEPRSGKVIIIKICASSDDQWIGYPSGQSGVLNPGTGEVRDYVLSLDNNGTIIDGVLSGSYGVGCDVDSIPRGYFSPAPVQRENTDEPARWPLCGRTLQECDDYDKKHAD